VTRVKELPELIGEFIELTKQYVRERTVDQARALGRGAGFAFAAGFVFFLAAILLAIAGTRAIVDLMPDGNIWSGFGYVISAIGLVGIAGLIIWRASK
jgi:hypothetical protein